MDNNRRSLVATLGPWLGVILILVAVSAGANHLREAQEELAHRAKVEAIVGPLPSESASEETAEQDSADAESDDTGAGTEEESAATETETVSDTVEASGGTIEAESEPAAETSEEGSTVSEEGAVDEDAMDEESTDTESVVEEPPAAETSDEPSEVDDESSAETSEDNAPVSEEEAATDDPAPSESEVEASEVVTESETLDASDDVTDTDEASEGAIIEALVVASVVDASEAVTESLGTAEGLDTVGPASQGMGPGGMGSGMGGSNMRAFHMEPIPEEYAGLLSPIPADEESLARGEPIYVQNCATCHGETGLGDGPAAVALVPAPPMIAMTSQMLGDDYVFWRVSEGGAFEPFNSAMPTWKASLDEDARWDVINFVRSLGKGQALGGGPGTGIGRSAELEEAMRAEMLAAGIDFGVVTQEEADLFDRVHAQIDALRASDPDRQFVGTMRNLQDQLLEELVADGSVEREGADTFNTVLGLLEEAGLMQ